MSDQGKIVALVWGAMVSIGNRLVSLALALCVAVVPLPALAQMKWTMTVQRFQKMAERGESGELLIGYYLHSFWHAAHQTHLDFTQRGYRQKPLYCIPAGARIVPSDIRDELLREFAAQPELYKPDTPLGPVVLKTLQRKYPCS